MHEFRPEFMNIQNLVWIIERNVKKSDTHQTEVICISEKTFCISDTLNFLKKIAYLELTLA